MHNEGRTFTKADFGLIEIRHSDIGLGEKNEDTLFDEWLTVIEVREEAYHQLRDDSNYGRTVCGNHLSDYVLVPRETLDKFMVTCQNGCWPIDMTPPLETSIMGNPIHNTSEPLKEMV